MPKLNPICQFLAATPRWPRDPRLARVLTVSLLVLLLVGCTVPPGAATGAPGAATIPPTAVAVPAAILDGSVQPTTFDQVKQAIDRLYSSHPNINSYVVKGVTYNLATRDKVLKICHEGGLVSSESEREAEQVLACAPLIFFFYQYGQEAGVPESTGVARLLYWYTVASHSTQAKEVLVKLLRSWGIT